jgi:DNA-binding beta-propeller fold protein YncE
MTGYSTLVLFASFLSVVLLPLTFSSSAAEDFRPVYQCTGASVGTTFLNPLGIFFDTNREECYVADAGNNRVVICDAQGMPLYHFYHHVERDGRTTLGQPKRVVVDPEGRIFVIDALVEYIDVLDFRGRRINRILPPTNSGGAGRFTTIALTPDGTVVATLTSKPARVAFISRELEIVKVVSLNAPEVERQGITGIGVDREGRIYITDPFARETMVQVYDPEGTFLYGFGKHDVGLENFSLPTDISVTDNGELWIVDSVRQVASRFTRSGEYIATIGGLGNGPGAFYFPSGITTDGGSRVFVIERGGNRYQCFRSVENENSQAVTSR